MIGKKNQVKLFGWSYCGHGSDHGINKINFATGRRWRDSKKGSIASNVLLFLFLFFVVFFCYELLADWTTNFVSQILNCVAYFYLEVYLLKTVLVAERLSMS